MIDIVTGVPIGGIGWGGSLPPQYANNVIAVDHLRQPGRPQRRADRGAERDVRRQGRRLSATPKTRSVTPARATSGAGTPRATCPSTPARRPASFRPGCCRCCPPPRPNGPMGVPPRTHGRATRAAGRATWAVGRAAGAWPRLNPDPAAPVRPWSIRPSPPRFTDQVPHRADLRPAHYYRAMKLRSISPSPQSIAGRFALAGLLATALLLAPATHPGLDADPDGIGRMPRRRGGVRPRATGIARRRRRR